MLVAVDEEKPGVVGVKDTCAFVAPIATADVDVVVLVAATAVVVDAFVVIVVGELAAVQLARRLEQRHVEGVVSQS
jgi:hypothetical protein